MKLRPYQERADYDVRKAWETDDILFLTLATGGGKTVIFTEVMRQFLLAGKRIMMVAHREELIGQAWKTLFRNNIYAGVIQSAVNKISYNGKEYPVNNPSIPAQVCSIQTIARRQSLPPADLIVIDEGHHVTAANTYGAILQRYPEAKVLIVSATPYRLSGDGFQHLVPGKVTRLIINSTLSDLIDDGWLVPIKFFCCYVPDVSGISISKGEYNEEEARQALELAPIVESYLEHAKGLQGLCFAQNVAHSLEIVRKYWQQGIPAEHVDANTPTEERARIITDFNAGLVKVVSNVGIFTEGTDFPGCDFIQLAALTKSLSKYLQEVGRGTRPVPGLVDPILTSQGRRDAIAASSKPHCIVLDNAGLFNEHFLPDFPHDWESHFLGTRGEKRKKKVAEEMEMLVFVAEDAAGNRVRTHNAKEIEGMRLVEITKDERRKLINIKVLKEFDRLYKVYQSQFSCRAPGMTAVKKYQQYCERDRILIVPEMWDYLRAETVEKIAQRRQNLINQRMAFPDQYPETMFVSSLGRIDRSGVSEQWLLEERDKYFKRNKSQMMDYQYRNMTPAI